MMPIDFVAPYWQETLRLWFFENFSLIILWTATGIVGEFGHGEFGTDRKFWRRNETLCVDETDFSELKSAFGIWNACSVLQLSTLEHVNSQYKIIFKIQCNISGQDFAAIRSEILLLRYIILRLELFSIQWAAFGCSTMSGTGSNNFGAFSIDPSMSPSNGGPESSKLIVNSRIQIYLAKTIFCRGWHLAMGRIHCNAVNSGLVSWIAEIRNALKIWRMVLK
jgi:hypothetical protein